MLKELVRGKSNAKGTKDYFKSERILSTHKVIKKGYLNEIR